ncbi:hypothetical protein [Streptomyces sp. NPDC056105]
MTADEHLLRASQPSPRRSRIRHSDPACADSGSSVRMRYVSRVVSS